MTDRAKDVAAPGGLTSQVARARLAELGGNELLRAEGVPWWRTLVGQLHGVMHWLLIGAAVLAAAIGDRGDALAILAIVLLDVVVGFVQERGAERSVRALRRLAAPRATVLRDGHQVVLPAREVVPGDLLVLEAGDAVAADARLVEANVLSTNEAPLTGESVPVTKRVQDDAPDTPLAERAGQIFMGTSVATGSARAEVTATGMATELGHIAHLLAAPGPGQTPLQQSLGRVVRVLAVACLAIVALVAALGFWRGTPPLELLLSSLSLAVAAVPEGMSAIVTVALAVGVQRMAARRVLVRQLAAVETLGCATVICTDKTGTLTTGVMTVRELWGGDHAALLDAAAACCDAELAAGPEGAAGGGVGDPTELAILAAARARGIERASIEQARPRRRVLPFDATRKRMSIVRADGRIYVKGAAEVVVPRCVRGQAGVLAASAELASRGLRVLAVAVGPAAAGTDGPDGPLDAELLERDLECVGLVAMADPPRSEAVAAIAAARKAGITTIMITGDHPATARAIARELGLVENDESEAGRIYARATAADKLRLIDELKAKGEIVAMTGDGVNDAPALRAAHIGVAMGKTGAEVTREAADMVLTDDNFASIVAAIREGRGIYDNIQKTLVYLLAGNASELLIMLGAALLGWPLPLLAAQLLWINLVTDGLPALALVLDPTPDDALARPPRRPEAPMLGRVEWRKVATIGLIEATVVLTMFHWALGVTDQATARSLAFSTLVFAELFRVFAARSATQLHWQVGAFTNLKLVGVVLASLLIQLAVHEVPAMRALLDVERLPLGQLGMCMLAGLVPVTVLELTKLVAWWRRGRGPGPGPGQLA